MIAMAWDEKYSVGIKSIDNEHKKLIDVYNAFYESIVKKEGKEKMGLTIKGLKDYTVYHFTNEEKLMQLYQYPGLELHKKEHDNFIKVVLDFENRYSKEKMILGVEITNFIREWIVKHIMETDKLYTQFLIEKGAK